MKWYLIWTLISPGYLWNTTQVIKAEYPNKQACLYEIDKSGAAIGELLYKGYSATLECKGE